MFTTQKLRLYLSTLILLSFFLPWIKVYNEVTYSGYKLSINPNGDPNYLFAVPLLGFIAALWPFRQFFIYVLSIVAIIISFRFTPPFVGRSSEVFEGLFVSIDGFLIGHLLTIFSFMAIMVVAYFDQRKIKS